MRKNKINRRRTRQSVAFSFAGIGAIFSDAEYESLPLGGLSAGDGIYTLHLDGAHTLFLLFENGKCTEVSLDTALDRTSADG